MLIVQSICGVALFVFVFVYVSGVLVGRRRVRSQWISYSDECCRRWEP